MSYEGCVEKLCVTGHYSTFDAFAEIPETCENCNKPFVWSHSVDETNGIEFRADGTPFPSTVPTLLEENGFEDEWLTDHYGNRYAVRVILFKIPQEV